jgi:hypothetical protein
MFHRRVRMCAVYNSAVFIIRGGSVLRIFLGGGGHEITKM